MFQFLAEINLLEYARSFVENGIDSIEGLTEFTDAQLDRIGVIPSEHRRCATAPWVEWTLRSSQERCGRMATALLHPTYSTASTCHA